MRLHPGQTVNVGNERTQRAATEIDIDEFVGGWRGGTDWKPTTAMWAMPS